MTENPFRLDGAVALVTGAATGIGAAIAEALASAGADVACHGNNRAPDATAEPAVAELSTRFLLRWMFSFLRPVKWQ